MHEENKTASESAIRIVLRASFRNHKHQIHPQSAREHPDHTERPTGDEIRRSPRTGHLDARGSAWTPFDYLFDLYDTIDHPALSQSPRETFRKGFEASGTRAERMIPYDREFLMATLPTTTRGTAKVTSGRGVKINHVYYWSAAFQVPGVANQQVPIRYDPFDVGTAYAFVDRQWVQCHSEYYAGLHGHSEKEIMIATHELRRRQQRHSQGLEITAKKLAGFLQSVEADEVLLAQRLRDREAQATRSFQSVAPSPFPVTIDGEHSAVKVVVAVSAAASDSDQIYGEF